MSVLTPGRVRDRQQRASQPSRGCVNVNTGRAMRYVLPGVRARQVEAYQGRSAAAHPGEQEVMAECRPWRTLRRSHWAQAQSVPGSRGRPRPALSVNPSTPCARNRRTHLYTKRRLIPTVAATSEIAMPSATSKIIRPRRARPADIVVARCHARKVWRTAGVRWIERAVLRPRVILIPHRQENMGPVALCQQRHPLSQTVKDTTFIVKKSNYIVG